VLTPTVNKITATKQSKCCMQFVSLRNLQNVLYDLATVRIRVRFRSEICKLFMQDFKIVQHILQIVQIEKVCTPTALNILAVVMC